MKARVAVIGGGLAGSEAAMIIAQHGFEVDLFEMKPVKFSPAHQKETLGELVCSNSLGSEGEDTAPGLLKGEMSAFGSIVLRAGEYARIPAGRALGVDRDKFSEFITNQIMSQPNIRLIREECHKIPDHEIVVIATGPLTSESFAEELQKVTDGESLYFYDSISPIVSADSIDYSKVYYKNRYEENSDDYLNCPMDRTLYERFVEAILSAEKVPVRAFEAMKCFEACLPIEVLAERGMQTLAFGPMKPVGLEDPRSGRRPFAVVQLRRENMPTTLFNLVGFQTRMKWGAQKEVFRMIPGLEKAEFMRMGSMHRNTYLNSPKLLNSDMSLRANPHLLFAGQITGVEGYVDSSAIGLWAGISVLFRLNGIQPSPPPRTSALGSLLHMITTRPLHGEFSPMNINFGLLPPPEIDGISKDQRRQKMLERAKKDFDEWKETILQQLGSSNQFLKKFDSTHAQTGI